MEGCRLTFPAVFCLPKIYCTWQKMICKFLIEAFYESFVGVFLQLISPSLSFPQVSSAAYREMIKFFASYLQVSFKVLIKRYSSSNIFNEIIRHLAFNLIYGSLKHSKNRELLAGQSSGIVQFYNHLHCFGSIKKPSIFYSVSFFELLLIC